MQLQTEEKFRANKYQIDQYENTNKSQIKDEHIIESKTDD